MTAYFMQRNIKPDVLTKYMARTVGVNLLYRKIEML